MAFHRLDDDTPPVTDSAWAADRSRVIGRVDGARRRKAGCLKPG